MVAQTKLVDCVAFFVESTFELYSEAADFVIGKEDVERKAERNAVSLVNDQKVSSS